MPVFGRESPGHSRGGRKNRCTEPGGQAGAYDTSCCSIAESMRHVCFRHSEQITRSWAACRVLSLPVRIDDSRPRMPRPQSLVSQTRAQPATFHHPRNSNLKRTSWKQSHLEILLLNKLLDCGATSGLENVFGKFRHKDYYFAVLLFAQVSPTEQRTASGLRRTNSRAQL